MSVPFILVAEDDPADALFLRQALTQACGDAVVFHVADGEAAVDYLAGTGPYRDRAAHPPPTHLILDIKMPRRSGLDVLRWLRARPDLAGLPVLVLSGSQLAADVAQARALGAEYLVKPIALSELVEAVGEYCRRVGLASR